MLHFGSLLQFLGLDQQFGRKKKKKARSRFQGLLSLARAQLWCPTGRTWNLVLNKCRESKQAVCARAPVGCSLQQVARPLLAVRRMPARAAAFLWRHLWQWESLHVPKVHVYSRRRIRLSWQPAPRCKWLGLHFFSSQDVLHNFADPTPSEAFGKWRTVFVGLCQKARLVFIVNKHERNGGYFSTW